MRHRSASSRRLGFKEFVESLSALGYEMGIQFEDIMVQLGCKAAGGDPSTLTDSMVGADLAVEMQVRGHEWAFLLCGSFAKSDCV